MRCEPGKRAVWNSDGVSLELILISMLEVASNLMPEKPGTKAFSRLSIQILTTENTEDTERASRFLFVFSVVFQECP